VRLASACGGNRPGFHDSRRQKLCEESPVKQDELARALQQLRASTRPEISAEGLDIALELLEEAVVQFQRGSQEVQRKLERVIDHQRNLDDRLIAIEHGLFFRTLRSLVRAFCGSTARAARLFPRGKEVEGPDSASLYRAWLAAEALATPSLEWHRERAAAFRQRPKISIILSVRAPRQEWLEAAVGSVLAQSYESWELCVCVAAKDNGVLDYLRAKACSDPRIRVGDPGGPRELNAARQMADGEYVGILGQHDLLSPYALQEVAETCQDSNPNLVYSDEDGIDGGGRRQRPVFKPDWSPDLLAGCMYLGRFLAISRQALERIDWLRSEYGAMQEYDAALRLAEGDVSVVHIPRILYHRRLEEEPGAHEAGRKVLASAVARRGWQAEVEDGPAPSTYRLRRRPAGCPLASIIVCSRQPRLLRRFLCAMDQYTSYRNREIVVVEHRTGNRTAMDAVLTGRPCTRVPYEAPFNFARMNNLGASAAKGEVLLFLNDDVEPLTGDWLDRMAAQAQRSEVGVVGAKLLYPSGAIQHAGIVIGIMDGAAHAGRYRKRVAHWGWLDLTRNVSAVTGACLAVRRQVFEELGGFDARFAVNYNDVDFCLRAREAGYQVIYEAGAVLRHYEARTRLAVVRYDEREKFHEQWWQVLAAGDPYYNPNLTHDRDDASLGIDELGRPSRQPYPSA